MNNQPKKDCCNGCQHGKPGGNPSCQAKLMMDALKKAQQEEQTVSKN